MATPGIFDADQLNLIRDAHVDWCAANSVDAKSALGEEAAAYLLQAFRTGCRTAEEMIAALGRFTEGRASQVQLGAPAIPSSDEQLPQ